MVITIFGASGRVGSRLVSIALAKGHEVRAFGRNVEPLIDEEFRNKRLHVIRGYVFNEHDVYNALKGSDAVLSALGGDTSGTDKTRSLGMKNIVQQMEKAGVKRIVAVGGLGILDAGDGKMMLDAEDYPKEYLAVGREHLEAYNHLLHSNLDWTIVGAPDIIDGDEDGSFLTNADYAPEENTYRIKAGNLALFMVAELEKNEYSKKRVGISEL